MTRRKEWRVEKTSESRLSRFISFILYLLSFGMVPPSRQRCSKQQFRATPMRGLEDQINYLSSYPPSMLSIMEFVDVTDYPELRSHYQQAIGDSDTKSMVFGQELPFKDGRIYMPRVRRGAAYQERFFDITLLDPVAAPTVTQTTDFGRQTQRTLRHLIFQYYADIGRAALSAVQRDVIVYLRRNLRGQAAVNYILYQIDATHNAAQRTANTVIVNLNMKLPKDYEVRIVHSNASGGLYFDSIAIMEVK